MTRKERPPSDADYEVGRDRSTAADWVPLDTAEAAGETIADGVTVGGPSLGEELPPRPPPEPPPLYPAPRAPGVLPGGAANRPRNRHARARTAEEERVDQGTYQIWRAIFVAAVIGLGIFTLAIMHIFYGGH